MSSQDVIELGSSDDEPEPAPKKAKLKPLPNSMVQIPSGNIKKLHLKQNSNAVICNRRNNFIPQNIKHNVSSNHSPYLMKTVKFIPKPKLPNLKVPKIPLKVTSSPANIVTNPIKIMNDNVVRFAGPKITQVKSINPFAKQMHNIKVNPTLSNLKTQSQKCLNKLPPSITVTKTSANEKRRIQPVFPQQVVVKKRKILPSIPNVSEILTVDLDDDDISEPRPHPVWCLKPEENTNEMETKNNNESEPQTVEIVIEDSPVKLPQNKFDNNEIGRILEITIDDSPVKLPQVNKVDNQSDSSADDKTIKNKKVPHSKKKLEYPNEVQDQSFEQDVLELNIEQKEIDSSINKDRINESLETLEDTENLKTEPITENNMNKKDGETSKNDHSNKSSVFDVNDNPAKQSVQNITQGNDMSNDFTVIEVNDSPAKQSTKNIPEDISKKKVEKVKSVPGLETKKELRSTEREIHPVYQSFIDLCFKIEDTDDMKKIVEKKIKAYYKEVPKQYTESEEFIEMVSSKILAINADPDRMYLYIKDIVDELNMQRKLVKSKNVKEKSAEIDDELEITEDPKKKIQIRKLEKALKKLHRAIQKLEEQEVDFDDEADSVYLLTESEEGNSSKDSEISSETDKNTLLQRYKERVVRVHAKLCKLTNTKMPSEPRVHVEARPGRPKGPAQRLEKWINKKVPIGTPLPFPDFHDVVRCVREANEDDKLGWNEMDIMEEARDLFMRCGKKLQRRRQENEWRVAASRISVEVDPAEKDSDLKKKLDENKKVANVKESQIIDKYVDRQNKLKLEPQEIGDKEADQSPMESDDEIVEESKDPLEENKTSSLDVSVDQATETKVSMSNEALRTSTVDQNNTDNRQLSDNKNENLSTSQLDKMDKSFESKNINEKVSISENISIAKHTEQMEIDERNFKESSVLSNKKVNEIVGKKDESVELLSDDEDEKGKSGDDEGGKRKSSVEDNNLLTVMYIETEGISTVDSSDVDCPIAISDTVETSSSLEAIGNGNNSSDVVSVGQTTNSDSDGKQDDLIKEVDKNQIDKSLLEPSNVRVTEVVTSAVSPVKGSRKSNEEYTMAIEDILLASDDESIPDVRLETDPVLEKEILATKEDNYINLKDDILTIEESTIENTDELMKPENTDEKVHLVPTESNSSPSVISLEDTCNTDTTDDTITKKIGISEDIMTSSEEKKGNHKEVIEVKNLSSVDSVCLSSEEITIPSNDIPRNINYNNKMNKFQSKNVHKTHDTSAVMPIEEMKLEKDVSSDTAKNEQKIVTGNIVKDVGENISNCKDNEQKLVTLRSSDSHSRDAATVLKDTS